MVQLDNMKVAADTGTDYNNVTLCAKENFPLLVQILSTYW